MRSPRLKLLWISLLLLVSIGVLDRAVYQRLIFLPEYTGGWDQFRWYVFEYHQRRIEASARDDRPLVLIVGSSIAKYSVQKPLLEAELARRGIQARVEMLVHASLMASDLEHYLPRMLRLKPRVIVYLTNPADLDLERYARPWEANTGYHERAFFEYTRTRAPMLMYYPGEFAWQHRGALEWQEQIRLHLRGLSPGLRFKSEWFAPLLFSLRAKRGDVRSYLNYQGVSLREGIWREGRTGGCFSVPRELLDAGHFRVQVVRELQQIPNFEIKAFSYRDKPMQEDAGSLLHPRPWLCVPPHGSRGLARIHPLASGWQTLQLPPIPRGDSRVFFLLSHVEIADAKTRPMEAGAYSHTGMGLRLPGQFGLRAPPASDYLTRRPALEDRRLALLKDQDYERDFAARVHPDDWQLPERAAVHQFNQLRIAKLMLNWYDFGPIPLARSLKRIASRMPGSVRLVVVNNPENPLTRETYRDSPWYRGYLAFLASLGPPAAVHDLSRALPMQSFSDAHHLTYYGMLRILPEYGRVVAEALGPVGKFSCGCGVRCRPESRPVRTCAPARPTAAQSD